MRGWRKLHSNIVASEKLGGISDAAFRLFTLLVVAQDDEGKYPWSATKIRSLTIGTSWNAKATEAALNQLRDSGVAELKDGFVYLAKGMAHNGVPHNSKQQPFVYEAEPVEQSIDSSESVPRRYRVGTDAVPTLRVEESRGEERREEESESAPAAHNFSLQR